MFASPALTRSIAVIGLAVALTAVGALIPGTDKPQNATAVAPASDLSLIPGRDLGAQIDQLNEHLSAQPRDARSWAVLALTQIEQARVTVDPLLYVSAAATADRSLSVQPEGNDLGIAAQATLASAQHRFTRALTLAKRALAINPFSTPALAIRVDALTELGRSGAALRAARRMDAVQPGLAASTRLAYQAEIRNRYAEANQLFQMASADASLPESEAFVEYHLGELARQRGDFHIALDHYSAAEASLPGDVNSLAGRASVYAASGHIDRGIKVLRQVVTTLPLPQHVIALGELLELQGKEQAASEQYAVVKAMISLASENGVRTDLELSQFEADHGDPTKALQAAREEWQRRHAPPVADAVGWALYQVGRSQLALEFAKKSVALGGDARAWHHLGAIQAALGHDTKARASLRTAIGLDRAYPAWQLFQLRQVMESLEATS